MLKRGLLSLKWIIEHPGILCCWIYSSLLLAFNNEIRKLMRKKSKKIKECADVGLFHSKG